MSGQADLDLLLVVAAGMFAASLLFARWATPKARRPPLRRTGEKVVYWMRYFVPATLLVAAVALWLTVLPP